MVSQISYLREARRFFLALEESPTDSATDSRKDYPELNSSEVICGTKYPATGVWACTSLLLLIIIILQFL